LIQNSEIKTQRNARYRLQVFIQGQNLLNQRNYQGYSGTMTSPFFGQPTAVNPMRKIDAGISLQSCELVPVCRPPNR
jgi:hypothetical protein